MDRHFPEILFSLRKSRNINQRTAAAELGISQALLSYYETGAREPGLGFICRACDYYNVSADYLLGRCSNPNPARNAAAAAAEYLDRLRAVIEDAGGALGELSKEINQ